MEEEGICYFFRHDGRRPHARLADAPRAHAAPRHRSRSTSTGARTAPACSSGRRRRSCGPAGSRCATTSSSCRTAPRGGERRSSRAVQAGQVTHRLRLAGNEQLELYDYPGGYAKRFDGVGPGGGDQPGELQKIFPTRQRSRRRSGCRRRPAEPRRRRRLDVPQLHERPPVRAPGPLRRRRRLRADERRAHGPRHGDVRSRRDLEYTNSFTCIPAALPFRPPGRRRRPVVAGPQTAVVVGPAGEEIFTDKYGRVKVQFHWDREGKNDENSSCWMRVGAAPSAARSTGSSSIPRGGREVVVDVPGRRPRPADHRRQRLQRPDAPPPEAAGVSASDEHERAPWAAGCSSSAGSSGSARRGRQAAAAAARRSSSTRARRRRHAGRRAPGARAAARRPADAPRRAARRRDGDARRRAARRRVRAARARGSGSDTERLELHTFKLRDGTIIGSGDERRASRASSRSSAERAATRAPAARTSRVRAATSSAATARPSFASR